MSGLWRGGDGAYICVSDNDWHKTKHSAATLCFVLESKSAQISGLFLGATNPYLCAFVL